MKSKNDFNHIIKVLEQVFNAGFTTEKSILALKLEDLPKIQNINSEDVEILINLKNAIKSKKVIDFLSGNKKDKIEKEGKENV